MLKKIRNRDLEESEAWRSQGVGASSSRVLRKVESRDRHNSSPNISQKSTSKEKIAIKEWTGRHDYVVEQGVRKWSYIGVCVDVMTCIME